MQKIYRIHLSAEERDSLAALPPSFITQEITRTRLDHATELRFISETMFPETEKITLAEGNLNIHEVGSLHAAFEAAEARRLAERLARHHTPKHESGLNITQSEIFAVTRE